MNVVDEEKDGNLFEAESQILMEAKKVLEQKDSHPDIACHYEQLVQSYAKLLRVTKKTFRISDIQGKILKDRELEIERVNQHLKQLEESRRQLISDISHELGTPMTSIQGYIKAMVDGIVRPEEKYLSMIYEKTLIVNRLIQDLFELSKLESNQSKFVFQPMTIDDLFNSLFQRYRYDVEDAGLRLVIDPIREIAPEYEVLLEIDLGRIDQVFTNLIYNALKFTPVGGEIRIHGEVRMHTLNHGGQPIAGEMFIHVTDTGIGIDEASLPSIFERFYKENKSNKVPGTGLGLAITKEIMLKHKGNITVTSKKNVGSTFTISLPAMFFSKMGECDR